MDNSVSQIYWKRLVAEGFVIVVSILLAFSIDAWWDQQQEKRGAEDQLARVSAELRASITILEQQNKNLDQAAQAATEFLSMMGPNAAHVSTQRIGILLSQLYGVATLSINDSAVQNFVSSGQLTEGFWVEIRQALAKMLSNIRTTEDSSAELRRMRPNITQEMGPHVSALDVVRGHPLMADYPKSKFSSDTQGLLSDMGFETLMANYAIRVELNRGAVIRLLDEHRAIIGKIEAVR